MFFKQLRDIAKPQWFEIIKALKCSVGLSVGEISEVLGMSYMGVKGHCVELEKRGYLDTWRRPKDVGRPEMAYRLTPKADALFPEVGVEFGLGVLESVAASAGEAAAEKLLFNHFASRGRDYEKRVKGDSLEVRVKSLVRIRESEGCMARIEDDENSEVGWVEYHSPLAKVADRFPCVERMEDAMLSRAVGAPVHREVQRASALRRVFFRVG
jgi:predicted ArsR family transcriptional regulator